MLCPSRSKPTPMLPTPAGAKARATLSTTFMRARRARGGRGLRHSAIRRAASAVLRLRGERLASLHSCANVRRSEEHTSELQSLMRISYAVFCLKKKNILNNTYARNQHDL